MAVTELLALGGPSHGEWFAWDDDNPYDLRVVIPEPIVFTMEPTPITDVGFQQAIYKVEGLGFKEENGRSYTRHVYRHESVPQDKALVLLQQYLTEMFIRAGD